MPYFPEVDTYLRIATNGQHGPVGSNRKSRSSAAAPALDNELQHPARQHPFGQFPAGGTVTRMYTHDANADANLDDYPRTLANGRTHKTPNISALADDSERWRTGSCCFVNSQSRSDRFGKRTKKSTNSNAGPVFGFWTKIFKIIGVLSES
jgi:hypothetical protein